MPDVTNQWEQNPLYNPLSPTVETLEEYFNDLEYEGNQITIEWATQEMLGHQMNWVRLGLVAERVRRYRLYRPQYADWNTFCMEVLGKRAWQMTRTINCAVVVVELIKYGSYFYPTCQAQAQALIDCCKKTGELLIDAWAKVEATYPEAWMLTANNICAALGFNPERNNISKNRRKQLKKLADRDGLTLSEKIDELIEQEEERIRQEEEEERIRQEEEEERRRQEAQNTDKIEKDVTEEKWFKEMKEDVERHDIQLWFVAAINRLFRAPKSQFSWLRCCRN